MKYILYLIIVIATLTSCDDQPVVVTDSSGKMNDILLVIDDDLWKKEVGDSIRKHLTTPVDGLVRYEPQFTLNQINPSGFAGLIKKNRNFIKVELSASKTGVHVADGLYASPQTGVFIRAEDPKAVINLLASNAQLIKDLFNQNEIKEKQRLMQKTSINVTQITERFGINLTVPRAYRYAAPDDNDFFWLRRNIAEGTLDLMIYEMDRNAIKQDDKVAASITAIRDSIGALKIPVDNGTFITERAFSPYVNETQIDGKFAYETKGLWDIPGKFMSGPFLNYAIFDDHRNKWLIIEGYIFAPSAKQRNYIFEIEAIIKSTKFKKTATNNDQ